MGFPILFAGTRRDDTPRLALPVWKVTVVVNNNVASFSGGLRSDDALGRDNLSSEWGLVLVHVHGNGRLVIIRFGLKEVFRGNLSACESIGSCHKLLCIIVKCGRKNEMERKREIMVR